MKTLEETPQPHTDHAQLLVQLLLGSGLVSRDELADFKNIARDLKLPLIQVMTNSGSLKKEALQCSAEALSRVQSKQISLDLAIRALRISVQKNCSLPEAIQSAQVLHKTTRVVLSASNDLTSLLLEAEIISREQLGRLLVRSHESSMLIGQVLVADNILSVEELLAALQTTIMIRGKLLARPDGAKALKYAYEQGMMIEQALFELEMFVSPDAKVLQTAELFLMARAMTLTDFVECLEIELFKQKEPNQILQERGFATAQQVESATQLLSYVANDVISPNEAAVALSLIFSAEMTVYRAVAEVRENRHNEVNVRLGDLVVDAAVCTHTDIETAMLNRPDSAAKVGNTLLKAGLVAENVLFAALRLQTSLRLGYLTRESTVALLGYCANRAVTVDQALTDNNIFVPCRIQWLWV